MTKPPQTVHQSKVGIQSRYEKKFGQYLFFSSPCSTMGKSSEWCSSKE
eukprot:CAMPEP_0170545528 /NCGR_PEP_ID=MMETSP0211-20121228/3930_1 /TAXON_ID=311385 /ORGANISM="Pseudokeronopsis sp., Strain OXSARD2" /LENGTH=47 /DNA_ID= /DNA_START= /DNA_END= /DNA_ORIENTATION=